MLLRIGVLAVVLSLTLDAAHLAQEIGPITNLTKDLGTLDFSFSGKWFAYSVREAFGREDLNGDGDRRDSIIQVLDLASGETTNLGLAGGMLGSSSRVWANSNAAAISGDSLAVAVSERQQGEDLNGDGDRLDNVAYVYDLRSGETTNLGFVLDGVETFAFSDEFFAFVVRESRRDEDLNGDGDVEDNVVHVHTMASGETNNLGLAALGDFVLSDDVLAFVVSEGEQLEDLNGDGDFEDNVVHVHTLTSGETVNLGLAVDTVSFSERGLVFTVPEAGQDEDLNGDGDFRDTIAHVHNLTSGETTNLKLSVWDAGRGLSALSDDWFAFLVPEAAELKDLNGDGDLADLVLHVHDRASGETTNLKLALDEVSTFALSERWLVFDASEKAQSEDLNGDGDIEDLVLHARDLAEEETTNLQLAHSLAHGGFPVFGGRLAFWLSENEREEDLSGDGDTDDLVLHTYDLARGEATSLGARGRSTGNSMIHALSETWLAFEAATGSNETLRVHHLPTGETIDLGLHCCDFGQAGFYLFSPVRGVTLSGNWLIVEVDEWGQGEDLNGDGDIDDDWTPHLVDLARVFGLPHFLRGDCSGDGKANIVDAVCILERLFAGGLAAGCAAAADVNGDAAVDIADSTQLLNYLFADGSAPLAPFPDCGPGLLPADEELGCAEPLDCQ